jgi:hypothetical protein
LGAVCASVKVDSTVAIGRSSITAFVFLELVTSFGFLEELNRSD